MMFLRISVISLVLCVCVSKELKNEILRAMEGRIVGGTPVNLDLYPHCAQIYNMGNMCAGSILNSWTVLTAAHCFDLYRDLDAIYVIVGARFTYDLNAPLHFVTYMDIHEKYNVSGYFACDIALLFLEKPIEYNRVTQKAMIVNNDKWMNKKEKNFTITGWGWTKNCLMLNVSRPLQGDLYKVLYKDKGGVEDIVNSEEETCKGLATLSIKTMLKYEGDISKLGLLMTQLRFIPLKKCARMHHHSVHFTKDMFCLYGDGVRDTCKGDSGGGVLWDNMIVGITSHGDKCAKKNSPSVYTNVWYFREWIEEHILNFIRNFCSHGNKTVKYHDDTYSGGHIIKNADIKGRFFPTKMQN